MMRWLLIGGTTEAREAFDYLKGHDAWVMISSATALGSEMFAGMDCQIHEGRLDASGFTELIQAEKITHVLDASHPYAVEVSKTVKAVAEKLDLTYYRYTRSASVAEEFAEDKEQKIIWCEDAASAAVYLDHTVGNIVFFTGVNTLKIYAEGIRDFTTRAYARVLNTESSRKVCETLWADASHYLCAAPPFDTADNLSFLKEAGAVYMVTKDSGKAGGMPEKMAAAKLAGCETVIIRRPKETEVLNKLDELEVLFQ